MLAKLFFLFGIIYCVSGDRESECTEVGYARSAGSMIHQSFDAVREIVLSEWAKEDITGKPTYSAFSPVLKNVTRTGEILEATSKLLLSMIRKTRVGKRCPELWLLRGIEKHVVPLMNLDKELSEELGLVMSFRCLMGSPYPNVDGTCINQENPDFGSIGSKFLRLLPATPGMDGFSLRGSSSSDKQLPSGRTVSNLIRKYIAEPDVTTLFKQWAHFIQIDTVGIPESSKTEDVDCCTDPETEDCAPIFLEEDDPDYKDLKCINFKRSALAQAILGHRESMTVVSTYLDATPLYGPTNEMAFSKKTGFFGLLKVPDDDDDDDEKSETKRDCDFPKSFDNCFTHEDPNYIAGLRYLLALEHNRLAESLSEINPHFDDSLLYNEARRVTLAIYNSITFGEYLKALLGEDLVKQHNLAPGGEGPTAQFIPQVNPGILVPFAVAAYRNPAMYTEWRTKWGDTDLLDSIQYTFVQNDRYKDMLAMDVQRARDQAVPGYRSWRRFCDSGRPLDKWEDFEEILPKEFVGKLKEIYQDELDDIDMSVALVEPPVDGAIIGKTFSCILADQYARLRTGNRLYWEHETAMFTEEQRDVIKATTAAGLICRNLPVNEVPKNAFLSVSENNPLIKCSDVPALDMTHWKDTSLIEKMEQVKKEKQEQKDLENQVSETKVLEENNEDKEIVAEPSEEEEEVVVEINEKDDEVNENIVQVEENIVEVEGADEIQEAHKPHPEL